MSHPLQDELVLICNKDDGYFAAGLRALATALRAYAPVVVCAPESGGPTPAIRSRSPAPSPIARGRARRLRRRRHPRRLRLHRAPLRHAHPPAAPRSRRLGDEPRPQPRRRRLLLGHRRRRARGGDPRHPPPSRSRPTSTPTAPPPPPSAPPSRSPRSPATAARRPRPRRSSASTSRRATRGRSAPLPRRPPLQRRGRVPSRSSRPRIPVDRRRRRVATTTSPAPTPRPTTRRRQHHPAAVGFRPRAPTPSVCGADRRRALPRALSREADAGAAVSARRSRFSTPKAVSCARTPWPKSQIHLPPSPTSRKREDELEATRLDLAMGLRAAGDSAFVVKAFRRGRRRTSAFGPLLGARRDSSETAPQSIGARGKCRRRRGHG